MRWHYFVGLSALTISGVTLGCGSDRANLAAAHDPELARAIDLAGSGLGPLSRAQKPDGTTQTAASLRSPLGVPPERSGELADSPAEAKISVVVNGEAILDEEIKAACYQALVQNRLNTSITEEERGKRQVTIFNNTCEQIIEREIVLQDAFARLIQNAKGKTNYLDKLKDAAHKEFDKQVLRPMKENNKWSTDEEVRQKLKEQKVSLEMLQRQWERQFMASEYLRNLVYKYIDVIGHVEVAEYYEKHPEQFKVGDTVEWQDLFINASNHPTRQAARLFAETLVNRINQGEDFVKLAREFDNGDAVSRENCAGQGKKLGEISPREAEMPLFQMHDGDVRIVELPAGYHVIKLVKRQFAGQMPFDAKVQKQILEKLRNEVGQREMKRIVKELRDKSIVEKVWEAH
jgi:hypothetical protein